ncbi:MAG TPA: hypothetical protein VK629_14530 [Steroidobacteraceae bacterium]|nr:hypothetical protein [Steroidobacteraceae bacterium]
MNIQISVAPRAITLLFAVAASLATTAAVAQQKYKAPRTEYGQPDLQGVWTNATITPLQRSAQYGDRRVHTTAEAKQLEEGIAEANAAADKPTDINASTEKVLNSGCELRGFGGSASCAYNNFWTDPGTKLVDINGEKRTSIIVEPADGRIPAALPAAQARLAARREKLRGSGPFDGPEQRPLGERCIMSFGSSAGPPMLPLLYNNNYQIVQTKDSVSILVEMVHDTRVIRIDGSHVPNGVRKWMGDSIGRYEGDTLVVETTNFNENHTYQNASENRKVTEWFTRIGPDKILYRFTVDDPTSYAKPFSGELALNAGNGHIYEYACHEGNYALMGILAGAREEENAKAKDEKKK